MRLKKLKLKIYKMKVFMIFFIYPPHYLDQSIKYLDGFFNSLELAETFIRLKFRDIENIKFKIIELDSEEFKKFKDL